MSSEEKEFPLGPRYKFQRYLGKGSYGLVGEFIDQKKNQRVAIKKMPLMPSHMEEMEKLVEGRKILREIKILHNFQHNHIIRLQHVIVRPEEHALMLYLVQDVMDADLRKVIKNSDLSDEHVQYIAYQIFVGLFYIHSGNVLHRDIKPNNILANEECKIVLCDFGFAREAENLNMDMTEYVVTRIYRAPEIVLCPKSYSKGVDIWAVGCTFYELLTKAPLFNAKDYKELIVMVIKAVGTPSEADLNFITRDSAKKFINSLPYCPPNRVSNLIPKYPNKLALDLLDRCLAFDPNKRISAEAALRHPYFASFFKESDLATYNGHVDFSFETNPKVTAQQIKKWILEEINLINAEAREELVNTNL